jgi:hypothetical protein
MINLGRLRVSLTKNGPLKVARLIRLHPAWELLDHLEGSQRGVNIKRSQIANILGADPLTGQVPQFWNEIREYGDEAIDAFVFLAIVLSHHRLIEVFKAAAQGSFEGCLSREDLTEKEYTNLVYAMAALNLCPYARGAEATTYDFYPLIYHLQPAHDLVRQLIASKLSRCGWLDPTVFSHSPDQDLVNECRRLRLNEVLAMKWRQFREWLDAELEMDEPDVAFGLRSQNVPRHPR